jgi:putative MATE family efflux protein
MYGTMRGHIMKFGPSYFYKRALSISLPVMAQLLIQNLVSLIDNFMVAGLGDIKMSGVNIAGQINFIFLVLVNNVLCNGGGIFMSQYKGAGDKNGMQQVFRYKLLVCVAAAAAFTAFCAVNPAPVLALMVRGNSAAKEIISQAVVYENIIAWTWIPMAVSMAITSSLRETGEVRVPLIISVTATVINTIGNYALIYGHFGAPRLEVAGAAIATIIARFAEMIAFIVYITVKRPDFFTNIYDIFKVKLSLVGTILAKSAMIAVSEMTWVFSETISTALYNSRGGAEIVSGMAAGFAIANLFFVSFSGIFTSTGVIMGTTLGAGKLGEAREQKGWIESGSIVFGIFFGLLGCASVLLIPLVFANLSTAARVVSRGLVFTAAAYMPLWCLANAQFAISRTGGDTTMGVIVDLTANLLIYVPGMFMLTRFTTLGPVVMYAIVKISDLEKVIVAATWLKKERWLKNLAKENAVSNA